MRFHQLIMVFCLLITSSVYAAGHSKNLISSKDSENDLALAKALVCSYPYWVEVTSIEATEKKLKIDVNGHEGKPSDLVQSFIEINTASHQAKLKSGADLITVNAIENQGSLSFIQADEEGTLQVTTVFPQALRPNVFSSVLSAHAGLVEFHPTQRYGFCRIVD